jgi:hypothetical protein
MGHNSIVTSYLIRVLYVIIIFEKNRYISYFDMFFLYTKLKYY